MYNILLRLIGAILIVITPIILYIFIDWSQNLPAVMAYPLIVIGFGLAIIAIEIASVNSSDWVKFYD